MRPLTSHSAPFRTGILALVGLFTLALTLVATVSQTAAPGAAAEPPAARPGYAVVGLFVAGNRISETQVAGVGGATFGLFTSRPPEANLNTDTGIVSGITPVATCTSTADGWCNAEIPIGTGAGQVASGTRLWISPIALPGDWTSPAYWQTAPLTTTAATRLRTQHVFQTPALTSNSRFVSGTTGWLSDPGNTVTDTAFMTANGGSNTTNPNSGNYFQRRTASAGYWPLIEGNPSLHTDQCGVNIAFVIDLSSSVQQAGELGNLKTALANGVDALRGTPSQVALVTFGTGSPANGFPNSNTNLMPVASTADANRVKDQFAGWSTIPTNYTNWDAPLNEVAAINQPDGDPNHIDIAIVLTDGNPTVYGDIPGHLTNNPTIPAGSGFTRFRELENATASANRVKSQGTRVVAVGVGDGLDERSSYNLRTISGSHKYAGTGPVLGSDYLQESSYAEAAQQLRSLIVGLCAPSISVVKQIVPAGGTIADAYTPSTPWEFTASTTTAGASVTPPPSRQTDTTTGATNFDVTVPNSSTADFDVAETPQAGYTLRPVSPDGTALDPGGQNAYCTNKGADGDEPVTVTNVGNGFTVHDMNDEAVITCVVYNEAPDFAQASVVVHKRWRVTTSAGTTTYDEGQQPEDLQATLRLGGPAPAGLSEQSWSVVRHGYRGRDTVTPPAPTPGESVPVAEDVGIIPPGCTLTSATMAGTGITGDRDLGTTSPSTTVDDIQAGLNAWTITNAVTCHSHLILHKQVVNGPASPDSWTLHAHGPASALTGPSGTTGVAREVTPQAAYQLAEQAGDDPELLNYVQPDQRDRPLQWPQSTGSVDCVQTGSGGAEQPGDPMGVEGAVMVPLGQTMTCTFSNVTASLTVIKDVSGGTADPSDFHFSVEPVAPHPDGLPARHFEGAAAPGHSTIVRPGQRYRISETGGPGGYQLTGLRCTPADLTAGDELTIAAGASAVCTATNSFSTWTAEKSSDPAPGRIDPGTTITYTLTARHLDGNPTHDVIVTDDLTEVLRHATFVDGSIDASAGTAHLAGDTIEWTIPVLHDVETVRFQVHVDDNTYGATLSNQLGTHTTGDPSDPDTPATDGDKAVDCATVTGDPDCASTVHTVADRPGVSLPGTGGPRLELALGGALLLALGVFVVAFASRRRRTP